MQDIITNSLRYNRGQFYLCYDMETENLNLNSHNRPWQLGFIVSNRDEILETHNYYIKWPDLNVSEGAARATGFDKSVVDREGKNPKDVLLFFESYLYNPKYRVCFFNGLKFDCYIHNIWRKQLGLDPDYSYIDRCIDVRSLVVADKIKATYDNTTSFLFWQYRMLDLKQRGLKSNLAHSCKEYGVKANKEAYHDAIFDCVQTQGLLVEMLKRFDIK